MNLDEAYSLLEASQEMSDDELKSIYKKLAKKHHPDIDKENPDKFKKINEAYQLIKDYRENPHKHDTGFDFEEGFGGVSIQDLFNNFMGAQQQFRNKPPIQVQISVTFEDSVLGTKKIISYDKEEPCPDCSGQGGFKKGNGCDACDGFGRVVRSNGPFSIQSSCSKCYGRGIKKDPCLSCNKKGCSVQKVEGSVDIPPGIQNGITLRLRGAGDFIAIDSARGNPIYSDVFVHVQVMSSSIFTTQGNNICSRLEISLLDALKGCKTTVSTVYGPKEISIPPKSKNKEIISIAECGIKNTSGNHLVELIVNYPEDVSKLEQVLSDV